MIKQREKNKNRKVVEEFVIPKCSSKAFVVKKGQVLRVIAHEGKQVADLRFLNLHDFREQFSGTTSEAWNSDAKLSGKQERGGIHRLEQLYSKWPFANVMLTVIDDKIGDHRMNCQCSPKKFEILGEIREIGMPVGYISCADLFEQCLKPYHLSMVNLEADGVFNVFMPIRITNDKDGTIEFAPPSCEKDDYIEFLAEKDILVAATSCPEENIVNDYKAKGMKYQILE